MNNNDLKEKLRSAIERGNIEAVDYFIYDNNCDVDLSIEHLDEIITTKEGFPEILETGDRIVHKTFNYPNGRGDHVFFNERGEEFVQIKLYEVTGICGYYGDPESGIEGDKFDYEHAFRGIVGYLPYKELILKD